MPIPIRVNSSYRLVDGGNRLLGTVTVLEIVDSRVKGQFTPAPDFERVREIFEELEQAINQILMAEVDELEGKIEDLGLHLVASDGSQTPTIHHVQIFEGKTIYFRIRGGYQADFTELTGRR